MTLTFADTHNMVAYLNKSDASEGLNQTIDFLNGSYITYVLTVNPTIYMSCIKQFWNTVAVKQSNDVTRLQALVDKKKVVVTEVTIKDALHLDDAEGLDCLPNEEIFTTLARMGYEKPSTKLTFYKAFFSSQWKFLIHMILQSMSAKRTSWNKFSSAMASVVICLSTGVKTPLFEGMLVAKVPKNQGNAEEQSDAEEQSNDDNAAEEHVTTIDDVEDQTIQSPTPLTPPPQQPQNIPSTSQVQSPPPQQQSPHPAQPQEIIKLKSRVKKLERANKVKTIKLRRLRKVRTSQRIESLDDTIIKDVSNQGRMIDESDKDEFEGRQADIYHIAMDHATKVLSMQKDEPKIQEAVEVVTTAKLITEVVTAISEIVSATAVVQADVPVALVNAAAVVTTAVPVKVDDKGKGIMVEEPKPMKKKQQVELDEAYARKLQEELNQDINWEVAMDHVKQKDKENSNVQRYQVMKKRPQTEAQARRNMMAKFNANMEFLLKSKEQMEKEESRAITLINETPTQKAAKRRRLNKEAEDVEELKQHLEIVPDEYDDIYTEATPLARKVPVVDY
nr:ribonuclease H-like domain, reverse transcriptase, RNA-dependent DNA polymerase [Tanacetum cinerariifolium]